MKKLAVLISLVLVWPGVAFPGKSADGSMGSQIDIPFEKFVLPNGLTLIVHEDHKAPIVGVNVWYHVGSKNEKPGRTGFAHLFEHLMFNGTEHWPGEFFEPLEEVGATGMNGTTNADRTNYFENVPKNALDLALWLESDRMGHMQGAISKEKLDEQRGVVQNEKRQGENQPYGRTWTLLTENTYPAGHPYSWSTIGSMADLDAAELDDVKEWFKTYYGAANAVLSIAGDVDAQEVKKRVEHYFGDIPSGPPVDKKEAWIAKMTGTHRQQMQDRVPQARIYRVWNVPQWGTREAALLDLVGRILGRGKTSRLYKRLVYQDQIATDVSAYVYSRELGGQFQMISTAHPSKTLGEVERALAEEVEKLIQEGPTQSELDLARTQVFAGFVRGLERVGGFGGKSDTLAANEVYGGSPDTYKKYFRYLEEASSGGSPRRGSRLVVRRGFHPGGPPVSQVLDGRFGSGSGPVAGRGRAAARRVSPPSEGDPVQRSEGDPGRAPRGAHHQLPVAHGCRICRRSGRTGGDGQPDGGHDGRGDLDPQRA